MAQAGEAAKTRRRARNAPGRRWVWDVVARVLLLVHGRDQGPARGGGQGVGGHANLGDLDGQRTRAQGALEELPEALGLGGSPERTMGSGRSVRGSLSA